MSPSEVVEHSNVAFEYEIESILRKDSLDMTDEDRHCKNAYRGTPPGLPATLTGLTSLSLLRIVIPEPSTLALSGLTFSAGFTLREGRRLLHCQPIEGGSGTSPCPHPQLIIPLLIRQLVHF